jgi:hypothetical protein
MEDNTPVPTLDEQLDRILHPLGVRREGAHSPEEHLNRELDRLLHRLGVRRELPGEAADQSERAQEADGASCVHLHFLSVLCKWDDAPRLKERLEALSQSAAAGEVEVQQVQGRARRRFCNFMILTQAPFPPYLLDQLGTWEEVCDCFGLTISLDLISDGGDAEGTAS